MSDNRATVPGADPNRNALPRCGEPESLPDVSFDDHAMVQTLQQAVAMHYPVPDANVAWRHVLRQHTHQHAGAGVPHGEQQEITPPLVMNSIAPPHRAVRTTQDQLASPTRVAWRSALGVAALVAVIVLGFLGSARGIIDWPRVPAQTEDSVDTLQAVSPDDQEVLALDPEKLGEHLGTGWNLTSAWSGVADVGASDFTGFLGSTRFVFRGPEEALITVDIRPVAGDPASPAVAWAWAKEDALYEQSRLVAGGSSQPTSLQGCRDALHMEGARKADHSSVGGVTLCAVDSSEIVLTTTAGEVLGSEGWTASDRVATFVAAELAEASIVPTHRYEGSGAIGSGLYQNALLNAPLVQPLNRGARLRWTGDAAPSPDSGSKTPWLRMRTVEGMEGWVPGELLDPAVEGEVSGPYPLASPVPA